MARPTDVPTTKRKPLTKRQRTQMHERDKGICCICGTWVDPRKPWVDEHKRALGLGGSNDMENRSVAHIQCAAIKTLEKDMPAIVKAKRQKDTQMSRDPNAKPTIQSPPFPSPPAKAGRSGIVRTPVAGMSEMARRYGVK